MAADPKILDMAVRAFRQANPMRWESGPCTCTGCIVTILANYKALQRMRAAP